MLWSEDGGPARPGRLDLTAAGLTLAGGSRLQPEQRVIGLEEIVGVRIGRHPHERVSGRAALLLALRDGRAFSIASLSSTGTLRELSEQLEALLGAGPEDA